MMLVAKLSIKEWLLSFKMVSSESCPPAQPNQTVKLAVGRAAVNKYANCL